MLNHVRLASVLHQYRQGIAACSQSGTTATLSMEDADGSHQGFSVRGMAGALTK